MDKYAILCAMDGKNFFVEKKKGNIDKLWDYFNFSPDIRECISLNRFVRFRLVNLATNKVIGELPR